MAESTIADVEREAMAVAARALPAGWRWVFDRSRQLGLDRLVPVRLESPEGKVARRAWAGLSMLAAYADGLISASELIGGDFSTSHESLLSLEFEQLSVERLPAPARPEMLEKYVDYCCQAAALGVLAQSRGALSRTLDAIDNGEFPATGDASSIQEALAASAAAMEYAETCKQAICAALRRAGAGVDLVDTIASAARSQARWFIAAGEPADETLGAKFLEEQFDGVRPEPPGYVEFEPAGEAWKTDRELTWEKEEGIEEAFWRSVDEAAERGEDEPRPAGFAACGDEDVL